MLKFGKYSISKIIKDVENEKWDDALEKIAIIKSTVEHVKEEEKIKGITLLRLIIHNIHEMNNNLTAVEKNIVEFGEVKGWSTRGNTARLDKMVSQLSSLRKEMKTSLEEAQKAQKSFNKNIKGFIVLLNEEGKEIIS
jgi:hypothetical protein